MRQRKVFEDIKFVKKATTKANAKLLKTKIEDLPSLIELEE
jgi:hypothetical protein